MDNNFYTDCSHFIWDRPCAFHKRDLRQCQGCADYLHNGPKILVVKLAALGDVLRTTCLLETLHRVYQNPSIVWITAEESVSLLGNNPLIREVWTPNAVGLQRARLTAFDMILSPDCDRDAAMVASIPASQERRGFFWDSSSNQVVFTAETEKELFTLSHNDIKKKENRKTYQQLVHEVCGLSSQPVGNIIFQPLPEEIRSAESLLQSSDPFNSSALKIGFVTGAGRRWQRKSWPPEYYVALARTVLEKHPQAAVYLLGGSDEESLNEGILQQIDFLDRVFKINTVESIRLFGAVFTFMDLVVTGDTLGLHLAIAAKKRVVCLVGPTSGYELELYGLGQTIITPLDCHCCYQGSCDHNPSCMESIYPKMVSGELEKQLSLL